MDIKGNVTISLDDYEKIKLQLKEFEELKNKIDNLYKKEFSHVDKVVVTIDEYNIVKFFGEYLDLKGEPLDVNVEDYKIKVEWEDETIPF